MVSDVNLHPYAVAVRLLRELRSEMGIRSDTLSPLPSDLRTSLYREVQSTWEVTAHGHFDLDAEPDPEVEALSGSRLAAINWSRLRPDYFRAEGDAGNYSQHLSMPAATTTPTLGAAAMPAATTG